MKKISNYLKSSNAFDDKILNLSDLIARGSCTLDEMNEAVICHVGVRAIEQQLPKEYANLLQFVKWDDHKWKEVSKQLKKDNKKFNNTHIDNLIEDIADFSVNGHSFIKFKNKPIYIDPYLSSLHVPQNKINEFDKYLYGVYKKLGITH